MLILAKLVNDDACPVNLGKKDECKNVGPDDQYIAVVFIVMVTIPSYQ